MPGAMIDRPLVDGPPGQQPSSGASLARALAWTAAVKWSGQAVSWIATLVVARLLSPHDYGVVALATVCLGLVTIFNEFGLGLAVIAHRNLTPHQLAQINAMALVVGLAAVGVSWAAAWPLGYVLGVSELPGIVCAMSTVLLITAVRTVPVGVLQRDLRFGRLAVAEGVQTLVGGVSTVASALAGLGYWALVIGHVLGALVFTILALAWAPTAMARPRARALGEVLIYSRHILVGRFTWYVSSQADHAVIGMTLGGAALGIYSMAWSLAALPLEKVGALLSQVTPGFFAASQSSREGLRRLVTTLTEGLALVAFPAAAGLALVAPEFIALALGERWRDAIVPLQVLAALAAFRSIQVVLSPVILVAGSAHLSMYLGILDVTVLPLALYVGSGWGVLGVATAYALAYPIIRIPLYVKVFQRTELSVGTYVTALWPALSAVCVMSLLVGALKLVLPPSWPLIVRFAVLVLLGVAGYLIALTTAHRSRLVTFFRTFRDLRDGRESGTEPVPPPTAPGFVPDAIRLSEAPSARV
jgi:O-antigen/teichoic acid export membrane protein